VAFGGEGEGRSWCAERAGELNLSWAILPQVRWALDKNVIGRWMREWGGEERYFLWG
jgi:hypothetical protein